nr:FtsW/RodA/SpoVE family cell cycle protein [Candidatus Enterousia merdequi]
MLRITHGEESKFTSWYFEIDRKLLVYVLSLIAVGLITLLTAGAADATRLGYPWYHFIKSASLPYLLGVICLFVFSMLNKKQIIKISVVGLLFGILALLLTAFSNPFQVIKNGSHRWINIAGQTFMPSDIIKPFFIVITAWFLALMHKFYGGDIFLNKEAWKMKLVSWWPYLAIFAICLLMIFRHPDFGTALLYVGILFVMLLVAGFPKKWIPAMFCVPGIMGVCALMFMPHIRARAAHIFDIVPRTQAWYSINSIKHGGLFGVGTGAYVQDVLPESTNDFVFSALAEVWGALIACLLVLFLLLVLNNLINHAIHAKDNFVVYALSGMAALFGGQICFNLMTALHLVIDKGMTLPFISYGGVSFITFCILFGIALAIIREDTWNR